MSDYNTNIQVRYDTLMNLVSGLGTYKDKATHTMHYYRPLTVPELAAAYRTDWIARKIIKIPAYDATREWREWQADVDQVEKIEKFEADFKVQKKVRQALEKARLYGGAALILGVGDPDGDPREPLDVEKIGKDDLRWMHVVTRHELGFDSINWDVTNQFYGEPFYYRAGGPQATDEKGQIIKALEVGREIHPSRVIRFIGNEPPNEAFEAQPMWGDSVLQVVDDAVRQAGIVSGGISAMIHEWKVDVFKMPGFTQNVATPEGRDRIQTRLMAANTMKSIINAMAMDSEEEWERLELNLANAPETIQQYLIIASGAADIPATRMLGQAPKGLNATGESDIRNYYDRIRTEQKNDLQPELTRFDEIMLRSIFGTRDPDIYYEWRPLWQLADQEKADRDLKRAQATQIYVNSGLLPEAVMAKVLVNQLIEDGVYPGLDTEMADFDFEKLFGDPQHPPPEADPIVGITPPRKGQAPPPQFSPQQRQKLLPPPDKQPRQTGDAFLDHWSMLIADLRPRTLYVYRKVLNAKDIIAWARSQGFTSTLDPNDIHVTIMYSKEPVDWMKMGQSYYGSQDGKVTIPPGGPRVIENFGDGAVVLAFGADELVWRHQSMRDKGASYDYEDYQPHITITYEPPDDFNVDDIEPYQGEIVLGPEVFEEIVLNHLERVSEMEV